MGLFTTVRIDKAAPPRVSPSNFGEHHAVEVQTVVEFLGCVHGILSGHGIYHEERLVGVDTVLDGGDFLHHLFVHRQASGRIDDDHVVTFGLGFFHSVLCNLHGILVVRFAIYGDADLFAQHFSTVRWARRDRISMSQSRQ